MFLRRLRRRVPLLDRGRVRGGASVAAGDGDGGGDVDGGGHGGFLHDRLSDGRGPAHSLELTEWSSVDTHVTARMLSPAPHVTEHCRRATGLEIT